MEKVIAFKAFNGRLFETEEKCLAYEKKYAEYPKVKYSVIPQAEGVEKCVKSTWEKPSSQRKDESYFLVGGKIRLYGYRKSNVGEMPFTFINRSSWEHLDRIACSIILDNGITFNDDLAEKVCSIYNELIKLSYKGSTLKAMKAEIMETDHKTYWVIEDNVWRGCGVSPIGRYVRIEKN